MAEKSTKEAPVWVEVTPDTVTAPADLLRVANVVFDLLRAFRIDEDPDLKEAIEKALDWDTDAAKGKVPYHILEPLNALPSREVIDARIDYYRHEMQAGRVDNMCGIPAFFSGSMLTADEVSRNTGIPEDELLREADSFASRFVTDLEDEDADGNESPRFYSEQFKLDGTLDDRKADYISAAGNYFNDAPGFFHDVFSPQLILGYVSPVAYASLSDEHLEACKETNRLYMECWDITADDDIEDLMFPYEEEE